MFKAQNRETKNSIWKLQDHYDDERDKIVFHNIAQNLQDQDRFLVSDRSCPKIAGLRPRHWCWDQYYWLKFENLTFEL